MGYVCDVWHFSGERKHSASDEFTRCTPLYLLISYSLCYLRLLKLLGSHQPLDEQPFSISQPDFFTILLRFPALNNTCTRVNSSHKWACAVIWLFKHSTLALPWSLKYNETYSDNFLKLDIFVSVFNAFTVKMKVLTKMFFSSVSLFSYTRHFFVEP